MTPTPQDLEEMQRRIDAAGDQHRMVLRCGSIVVLVKEGKRAIRVYGRPTKLEPSTRATFEALGWRFIDHAAGEEID